MFKTILLNQDNQWDSLDPVLQQHYAINDGESIRMEGDLAVKHGRFIKLLMPLIRLTGALVPVEGEHFCVVVENKRTADLLHWHRVFYKDNKSYEFNSRMVQSGNDIIEFVGLGIGIRLGLRVTQGRLVFEDKGYVIQIGKKIFTIPLQLLIGETIIEEYATKAPNEFAMKFTVNHPWFGFAFSYKGCFKLKKAKVY